MATLQPIIWEIEEFAGLMGDQLTGKDFTITKQLTATELDFDKGREAGKIYSLTRDENITAISEKHEDVRENGFLTGIKETYSWYNYDGTIFESKESIKSLGVTRAEEEEENRRARQITYLQGAGKRLGKQKEINELFKHYENIIQSYKGNGGTVFLGAINSETDSEIIKILNKVLADGNTIKQAILNQIT
jgi:hypothetical protein